MQLDGDKGGAAESGYHRAIDFAAQCKIEFAVVLKTVSHVEILKLYMFLLEKYKALDAATLHAIATFLGRLCDELRLEPMLYQVSVHLVCGMCGIIQVSPFQSECGFTCTSNHHAKDDCQQGTCVQQVPFMALADFLPQTVSHHPLR